MTLIQTWRYNTKLHDPWRKMGIPFLSRANFWMVWRWRFESYLITCMCKVLSQQLRDTLTCHLRALYSWKCHENGSRYVQINHGSTYMQNIRSTKFIRGFSLWNKNWRRCMGNYQLHKNRSQHFEEHCNKKEDDISMIIVRFLFFQTKLVFEFNLALITQSSSQFIYLFTSWYSVYLELSSPSASMRYL